MQHTAVGILGAGLSGVLMGMQLQRAGISDFVIYERQADVGGTWLRNTYPGLHCDIPSHLYSYSFEPNPDWSMVYAPQREIQAYIRACAERHGLIERIRFGTTVERARWDSAEARWQLDITAADVPEALRASHRVLIGATGGLTEPRLPRIEGLDTFAGPMWHSGAWRDDVDLSGRSVAVVGSAASAVQVVPEVAQRAAAVTVFSRTPNWVMPRNNRTYQPPERDELRRDGAVRKLRRRQYRDALLWHRAFSRNPAAVAELRRSGLDHLRSAISDPALIAALTPDYEPGCRRILVSDEYYPALAMAHVELVPQGVTALDTDAVVAADGSRHHADAVIFCTGYRLGGREDGRPAVEVVGRDGRRLIDALRANPQAYRGIAVPGFPNYFTLPGINGVVGYGAVIASAEVASERIATETGLVVNGSCRTVEARLAPTERFNAEIQAELATMSWAGACSNFYIDGAGRNVTFFPGTLGRMRRELRRVGGADLERSFS
ncbi:MAG: flavin-containing monooxygenase [Acidimicrobiales bacterium]